jgi:molybdopterin-synthase adenylyltransferase
MNDSELLRYNRQIMLPQIGYEGQQKLSKGTVFIVGVGGLGSPVALYLAAAGIGHLIINDFDCVDISNLQRQIIHTTNSVGQHKVDSAKKSLLAINPDLKITTIQQQLSPEQLKEHFSQSDVIVDCTDNFATRFSINRLCVETKKPLVSGAAIRMEGQVSVFDSRNTTNPCYQCLYKPDSIEAEETCSDNGVLATITGIIGTIQANEVLKLLIGKGETLAGRLLIIDGWNMDIRTLKLKQDPECTLCQNNK